MPVLPTWSPVARALRAAAAVRALLLAPVRALLSALPVALSLAVPAGAAEPPPQRLLTDLAALRRCTDQLLVDYGVRDLVVQLAEVDERAARGAGGLRELLPAAAGDITPRSCRCAPRCAVMR